MRCWTGGYDPLDDSGQGRVNILDLIMGLQVALRFGGAGDRSWSALHHSVLVCLIYIKLYGQHGAVYALLHDGHEGYTGDLPSPLKRLLKARGETAVKDVERGYDEVIAVFLGITPIYETDAAIRERVKYCDWVALIIEATLFGPPGARCWNDVPEEKRPDVRRLIARVMPDFAAVARARGHSPNRGDFDDTVYVECRLCGNPNLRHEYRGGDLIDQHCDDCCWSRSDP